MKLPKVDLEELQKQKDQNLKERLAFIEKYAEWVKSKKNKEWSEQQKMMIDQRSSSNCQVNNKPSHDIIDNREEILLDHVKGLLRNLKLSQKNK